MFFIVFLIMIERLYVRLLYVFGEYFLLFRNCFSMFLIVVFILFEFVIFLLFGLSLYVFLYFILGFMFFVLLILIWVLFICCMFNSEWIELVIFLKVDLCLFILLEFICVCVLVFDLLFEDFVMEICCCCF